MRGYVIGVGVCREEVCIVLSVGVGFITGEADKTRYGYILGVGVAGVSVQLRAQRREGEPWVALVIVWRRWTAPSVAVCLIGIDGSVFEIRINFCSCCLGVAVRVVRAGLEGKGTAHNIEIRERGLRAKLPSAHAGKALSAYDLWRGRLGIGSGLKRRLDGRAEKISMPRQGVFEVKDVLESLIKVVGGCVSAMLRSNYCD